MKKFNKANGGEKMEQKNTGFIEQLVAVDFDNRSEESKYK